MRSIDGQQPGNWPRRIITPTVLAASLLAATPACNALETGIVIEGFAVGESAIVPAELLGHHLARGDRVRIYERAGADYDLIIVAPGVGPATDLGGVYQATITGNTRTLNLREADVEVSLEQRGAQLEGRFDRGRGKLWGEIDGDRIRFEWLAYRGNGGRGEWRIMPDGRDLQGSWYSDWQGDGDWNMRLRTRSAVGRADAVSGERLPDRVRIDVPLDAIERIRLISPATASAVAYGDASYPSTETDGQTVTDLWTTMQPAETGFEIGALAFLGADFSVYHRPAGSPWLVGLRYVETDEDFISIDFDDSDQEKITIAGPFLRYLFSPGSSESFYLGAGLFRMSQEVECRLGSDEDSATGLFMGGGFMRGANQPIGLNVGIMVAPGLSLATDTGDCASETDGGFDVNASVVIRFR